MAEENNTNLLPEIDIEFLDEKGHTYKITPSDGMIYLVIENFKFPEQHYTPTSASLLIQIPAGYPNAKLDMFFVHPEIKLLNGSQPDKADQILDWDNKRWQRWSRHLDEWRAGKDNLRTYLASIKIILEQGQ